MATVYQTFNDLEALRRELGMPQAVLADRSGVSLPVVKRVLAGNNPNVAFANVRAIAAALGVDIVFQAVRDAEDMREEQASRKAEQLVGMVQATMGLEGQAVDRHTADTLRRKATHDLLAGSPRRLWGK